MDAVKAGSSYDLIDPSNKKVVGQLDARTVWDRMILGAWRTGEPGVFFVDEANRYNPVPSLGQYEATNPCGEQPLLPYDVCNLGSINVGYYVNNGKMDWDAFRADIALSTHFLDNIIDVNKYPLPEIDALSKRIRRIGLGVMGFADACVRPRHCLRYRRRRGVWTTGHGVRRRRGQEGKQPTRRRARAIHRVGKEHLGPGRDLRARCERQSHPSDAAPQNCNVTTVAPTGTISIIAGCSSGLEPLFAVAFMRNQAGVMMPGRERDFVEIAKREGWYSSS
jgi:ribonucleoside-diphosphate reductase alpha chain